MRMTIDEIRLVAFVIIALTVGASTKHWREKHRQYPAPTANPPSIESGHAERSHSKD